MAFNTELKQKLQEVNQQLEHYRALAFDKWGQYLFDSEIDHAAQLTTIQIAFLSLLTEKYQTEIYPKFQKKVYNCFFYYYMEEIEEINIKIHGLDIRDINAGEWQINFEDDTVNPLVVLSFNKWKLVDITLIG